MRTVCRLAVACVATGLTGITAVAASLAAQSPVTASARAGRSAAPALIQGTLLGSDGRPMAAAHVLLRQVLSIDGDGAPDVALVQADRHGRFAIATTMRGGAMLVLSGAAHDSRSVNLDLTPGFQLSMDVRLSRVRMRAQFDSVRVIGDFNGFRTDTSARPLVRQRDGTYSIDVPVTADSLSYALLKVSVRSSVPSTFDDRVIRSASGSYRSVAIVRGGVAHVVFDPTRLVRDTQPAWAAYGNTRSGDVARINDAIFAHNSRWNEAERAQQSMTAARWAPTVQRSMAALARERAPDVRAARLLELLALSQFGAEVPPAVGSMALRELPPGSPSWHTVPSLAFGLPFVAFRVADRVSHLLRPPPKQVIPTAADSVRLRRYASRYAAWTDSAVARQDNELKIAQLLQFGVAVTNGLLPQRASRYLGQMEAAYPNAASTKFALQVWGGQRVLRKGIAMPAFDVGALADSTKRISNTTLAGKYVLIDFWATWCSPCIGEMPTLHGAYEAFHSRGLELVSVSIDNAPSDVVAFRSARWPMPWQHAWVPGGLFAPALKSLDLYGVPHIVLPGPDGTIIAEQQDLRGVMLARTLDTLLPKSSER